jgi:hypothetical protein
MSRDDEVGFSGPQGAAQQAGLHPSGAGAEARLPAHCARTRAGFAGRALR